MIIIKGHYQPYWLDGNNFHLDIRDAFHIKDDATYSSLPVEFHCKGVLTEMKDWKFKIDIKTPLPQWYLIAKKLYQSECKTILEKIINNIKNTGVYEGDLNFHNTKIKSLGNLQRCGDLNLSRTLITSLGNLQECGDLSLYGTPIISLGNLQKCGDLDLYNTLITSLGSLRECGVLYLYNTPIKKDDIKNVKYKNLFGK